MQRGTPEWGNDFYEKKNTENILHYQRKKCAKNASEVQRGTTEKKIPIKLLTPLLGLWWNTQNHCVVIVSLLPSTFVAHRICYSHLIFSVYKYFTDYLCQLENNFFFCFGISLLFTALWKRDTKILRTRQRELAKFTSEGKIKKKNKLNAGLMLIDFLLSSHASNNKRVANGPISLSSYENEQIKRWMAATPTAR